MIVTYESSYTKYVMAELIIPRQCINPSSVISFSRAGNPLLFNTRFEVRWRVYITVKNVKKKKLY